LNEHFGRFFTLEDIEAGEPEKELEGAAANGSARDDRHHVRKDGSAFYVRGTITAIRQGERLLGFAKVIHDLKEEQAHAELRLRAKALLEADRMKDEFLAMLAHELRNPLAPILNAMQVLRDDHSPDPVVQQAKGIVERQARQMSRLIDDLLDVSRITSGKIELRKELVEVGVIIERAIETTRPIIESRRHTISSATNAESLWVKADPARLEQCLANLLTNAAKYTDPGGRIWITAKREGPHAMIRVRDTGVGISPGLLPRVFDLFVQADRSLDRSQGGLGIGLTMVKRIAALHGGTATARSDGPGKGSIFTVRLPVVECEDPVASKQSIVANGARTGSLRVLVIEDNVDSATSLKMLLGRIYDHDVMTAHGGTEGIELAEQFLPDLILLDIGLPGMDGFEVASHLRKLPSMQKAIIVALSGYSKEQVALKHAGVAHFDHHLLKPVDPDQLERLLKIIEEEEKR
jgi:signal transduction histidine kinase/ActR/RegA family two-component response regulator